MSSIISSVLAITVEEDGVGTHVHVLSESIALVASTTFTLRR